MEVRHSAPFALSTGPAPVSLEPPVSWARAEKPLPVWVTLPLDDGTVARVKGFAMGWTADVVLVQVLWAREYYRAATEVWVDAGLVERRVIEPEWMGRAVDKPGSGVNYGQD